MSQVLFGSLLNDNGPKKINYHLNNNLDFNYEKLLHTLVDETKSDFHALSPNLQSLSQMSNVSLSNLNSLTYNFSLKHKLFEPDSEYCESGDSEKDEVMSSSPKENLLEIENQYLKEQNRFLSKELNHCKFNVESYKKMTCTKEAQLEQYAIDQKNLKTRMKELENMVDWIYSHASPALLASCPYSPNQFSSSFSSLASEEDSTEKPSNRFLNPAEFNKKNSCKPDSYRFMKGFFKFNQSKFKDRSKDNDTWINCEDEIMEENIGVDSDALNQNTHSLSLDLPRLKTPKKDSRNIFSSLRLSKQSTPPSNMDTLPDSNNLKLSTADNCSRSELRDRISSRPTHSEPISPPTTSPCSSNSSEILEEEEFLLDVDADLAALSSLDFESDSVLQDTIISPEPESFTSHNTNSICKDYKNSSLLEEELSLIKEVTSTDSSISVIEINISSHSLPCKDSYETSNNLKEKNLESRLSISREEMINVVSINSHSISSQSNPINSNNKCYGSHHSSNSSLIDFEKLAQRPDRPLPLTPLNSSSHYLSLKLAASEKLKNGLSLFRIKKTTPIRRRSSHRRPISGTSMRSINGTNKLRSMEI